MFFIFILLLLLLLLLLLISFLSYSLVIFWCLRPLLYLSYDII